MSTDIDAHDLADTAVTDEANVSAARNSLSCNGTAGDPSSKCLQDHFDDVVRLLERRAELGGEFTEWRSRVRSNGLDANILIKIAREQLHDADRRRKAAEAAEIEELYRQGLGLPLFDWRAP